VAKTLGHPGGGAGEKTFAPDSEGGNPEKLREKGVEERLTLQVNLRDCVRENKWPGEGRKEGMGLCCTGGNHGRRKRWEKSTLILLRGRGATREGERDPAYHPREGEVGDCDPWGGAGGERGRREIEKNNEELKLEDTQKEKLKKGRNTRLPGQKGDRKTDESKTSFKTVKDKLTSGITSSLGF